MIENAKVDPSKISLVGLRVLKAHFESGITDINEVALASFNVGVKSESDFNLQENYQRLIIFVKIKAIGATEAVLDAVAEYQIAFDFIIDNLNDFVEFEKNKEHFNVSPAIGATVAGIAYSTCRGIVFDRTQGTDFNGVILPVINPYQLLSEDSFSDL